MQPIKNFYENYDEDNRLFKDKAHLAEWLTTIRYFDRLFAPGSRILDACAGTGVYSFYLADKGHTVTACDLMERHVELIKSKSNADKLEDIAVCNVLDLSRFEENSFDVVLCMGALYHLASDEEKMQAIRECARVCKSGGLVVLAYITKIGAVYDILSDDAGNMEEVLNFVDGIGEHAFTPTTVHKIETLAENGGLEKMHNIATDGLVYAAESKLNQASDENFDRYMAFHYSICEMPDVIGASLHGLWMGKKP